MQKQKANKMFWIENHICHIPLSQGLIALCDEDRASEVTKHIWSTSDGYARAKINGKTVAMHNFLYPELKMIDHINRKRHDNRACNLRECTREQNAINKPNNVRNKSGFHGVFKKKDGTFRAMFRSKEIGVFKTDIEAAQAYDNATKEAYKGFASKLNFPEDPNNALTFVGDKGFNGTVEVRIETTHALFVEINKYLDEQYKKTRVRLTVFDFFRTAASEKLLRR